MNYGYIVTYAGDTERFLENHLEIVDHIERCNERIGDIFTPTTNIFLECQKTSDGRPKAVAWIQSTDGIEAGLTKYDAFIDWYVDKNLDKEMDYFNFNIEFVE